MFLQSILESTREARRFVPVQVDSWYYKTDADAFEDDTRLILRSVAWSDDIDEKDEHERDRKAKKQVRCQIVYHNNRVLRYWSEMIDLRLCSDIDIAEKGLKWSSFQNCKFILKRGNVFSPSNDIRKSFQVHIHRHFICFCVQFRACLGCIHVWLVLQIVIQLFQILFSFKFSKFWQDKFFLNWRLLSLSLAAFARFQ